MVAPIISIEPKSISYVNMLKDSAPRRKLQAELAGIGKQLAQEQMRDSLSLAIANWHSRFVNAVNRSNDLEDTRATYISLLQEILVDDVREVPLDERALLGSDGHTYSFMSYTLYQCTAPAEFRGRSPFNPRDSSAFTTSPHHNAAHMVRWLQRYNAHLHSRELEEEYEQMMQSESKQAAARSPASIQQAPLPSPPRPSSASASSSFASAAPTAAPVPISIALPQEPNPLYEAERKSGPAGRAASGLSEERRERLRRLAEKQAQRQRRDQEEVQVLVTQLGQMTSRVDQIVQQSFAPIHSEVEAVRRRTFARVESIRQTDAQVMAALNAEVDRLRADVHELESENRRLERGILSLDEGISEAQKEDMQLKMEINATRIAIKNRKQSFLKELGSLVQCIAVIGACAFANWALGGLPGAFVPSSGGLGFAIPL